MIEFIRANKMLALSLLISVLFFLRKGIQFATIGSVIPLFIIIVLIVVLLISLQKGKKPFFLTVRIWAAVLIIWSASRMFVAIVHLTIKPFDGSFHLARQFNGYSLILSMLMLTVGVLMLRNLHNQRIKSKKN